MASSPLQNSLQDGFQKQPKRENWLREYGGELPCIEQTLRTRNPDQKQFPTIPPLSLFSTCWQYLCQKEVEE
jgi:hypothetical protein